MIRLIAEGLYTLTDTSQNTRILTLNEPIKKSFAWIVANEIGEILVLTAKKHKTHSLFAAGKYRLYEVKDEKNYADLQHLELFVGDGKWQGYLLPTGIPSIEDKRNRIIPTEEIITKSGP